MPRERTIILAKTLFDGTERAPLGNAAIVIEGERIVAVGPKAKLAKRRAGASIIDASAFVVLPGFINLHAHLDADAGPDFMTAALLMDEQKSTLLAVRSARQALGAGVTTLRDLGSKFGESISVRDAIDRGWVMGPRILAAGRVICMTGGHCWFVGIESDGPDEVRKAVRENLKRGADCIKIIATGGVLSAGVEAGSSQLDEGELRAAVSEAHKAGRRVAAHAIGADGVKNALRAGVDTLEHGCYLDADALRLFKKNGATYVPTLCAPHFLYKNLDALPQYAARKTREVYEAHRESFKRALRAGVRIATGTDAGTPFNLHSNYAVEIELMVKLGMPVERAIRAGTSEAAAALGLGDAIGTLEPGKSADVVIVDGDPRRDVKALQRVKSVMIRGKVV